jgi:hypothetical protein|eukprot:scaffold209_cov251-Chaetoceros_neogracile.AAC.2
MKERTITVPQPKEFIGYFHQGPFFRLVIFGGWMLAEVRILKEFDALYEPSEGLGVEERRALAC